MNRHPYGGYDGPAPRRRSASPPFRGGGYRGGRGGRAPRGRGGYAGNGEPSYDSYQNQDPYNAPPPATTYAAPAVINGDYPNGYSTVALPRDPYFAGAPSGPSQYEDYTPAPRGSGRGRGGRGRGGRGRDEKHHDSIIEERISRERPCRTLFVRNIKYESSSDEMRAKFEQHGEIKTFFDLIQNRGMVFVTYFDLRDAERARARLQAMEVGGRPIDCHYSLPREHELSQRCDRDKNQGTLLITLVQSPSRQAIDENELRRVFGAFGDIKLVKPLYMSGIMRPDQRLLEFFDSRACVDAHDRLHQAHLQDGIMNLEFEWDVPDQPIPTQPVPIPSVPLLTSPTFDSSQFSRISGGTRSPAYRGGGRSPPRRGPADDWDRGRPGPPYREEYPDRAGRDFPPDPRDRRGAGGFPPMSPIRDRERRPSSPYRDDRAGRDDRGYGGPPPRRDEWRPRSPPPRGPGAPPGRDGSDYGRGSVSNGPPYGGPPPTVDTRLEKAMEVQRLLEALKPSGTSGAQAPPVPAPQAPPPAPAASWYNGPQPPAPVPYTQPPHMQYGGPPSYSQPPPAQYGQPPASTNYQSYGQPQTPAPPPSGDVQSLLALLHQAQNQNHGPR